jgi:hypothetical protein
MPQKQKPSGSTRERVGSLGQHAAHSSTGSQRIAPSRQNFILSEVLIRSRTGRGSCRNAANAGDTAELMQPKATYDKISSVAELIRRNAPRRTSPDERG